MIKKPSNKRKAALAQFCSMYGKDLTKDIKKAMLYEGEKLPVYPGQEGREPQPGACYHLPNDGTILNPPTFSNSGLYLSTTEPRVFCGWFKIAPYTNPHYLMRAGGAYLTIHPTTETWSFPTYQLSEVTLGITTNEWFHLSIECDGVDAYFYINGILKATRTTAISFAFTNNWALEAYFTNKSEKHFYDIRWFERASLTTEERSKVMKGIAIGDEYAWYTCQERDGTKIIDLSGNNYHMSHSNATLSTFHAIDTGVKYNINNLYGYWHDQTPVDLFQARQVAIDNGVPNTGTGGKEKYNNYYEEKYNDNNGNASCTVDVENKTYRIEVLTDTDGFCGLRTTFMVFTSPLTHYVGLKADQEYEIEFQYRGSGIQFINASGGPNIGLQTTSSNWQTYKGTFRANSIQTYNLGLDMYLYDPNNGGYPYYPISAGEWLEIKDWKVRTTKFINPLTSKGMPIVQSFADPYTTGYNWQNVYKWRKNQLYKGATPFNPKLVENHCLTFNGVDQKLSFSDLTGVAVVSSEGTATPTINGNDIEFTAGTLWDLVLSDGTRLPCGEGNGSNVYDVSANDNHATITNYAASMWDNFQDEFAWNALRGFNDVGGVKVPAKAYNPHQDVLGNTITAPGFGRQWNNPEGKIQVNPYNAPELIQAGFDDTHLEDLQDPLPTGMIKEANNEIIIE